MLQFNFQSAAELLEINFLPVQPQSRADLLGFVYADLTFISRDTPPFSIRCA